MPGASLSRKIHLVHQLEAAGNTAESLRRRVIEFQPVQMGGRKVSFRAWRIDRPPCSAYRAWAYEAAMAAHAASAPLKLVYTPKAL